MIQGRFSSFCWQVADFIRAGMTALAGMKAEAEILRFIPTKYGRRTGRVGTLYRHLLTFTGSVPSNQIFWFNLQHIRQLEPGIF